ncbi:MAG: 4-(cytidine 5'-diphospho)-2-C-methyl-D-erythritol kinase [Coriobacteriia bacterium]|nr:4-(cytidine 5'-diphospho)-2-C-methyl-D-erythritol kinase [Coriobacteriia bacterium]
MIVISPAKMNLSLSIGAVRGDSYHYVDSFFHLLDLHDELHVTFAEEFSFTSTTNLGIPDADNLVVRAAHGMADLYGRELPAVTLKLQKHIPHGAGLGGGSSNAAATIYAISHLWDISADDPQHLKLAAQIGSDVPLFLAPTTASVMTGRGEILQQSRDPISGLHVLIVKPSDTHSSTGAVYKAFDTNPQPVHDIDVWKNNLEAAAVQVSPETGKVLEFLRADKCVDLAMVAGSGSASIALCNSADCMHRVAQKAQEQGWWTAETTTTDKGIHIVQ